MTATLTAAPAASTPDADRSVRTLLRGRMTAFAFGTAAVALPLLRPSGPGNTGLVDVALLVAIFASVLWASTQSHRIRLPYALPVGLTVVAGALAVTVNGAGHGDVGRSAIAILQDIFVFGWAAAVATLGRDSRMLDRFCRAWAYSTVVWAAILIGGELAGITWITGINSADGLRASLTFGDPNLAANYFLCGLLVMRAIRRPRHTPRRWICCALVVTALCLTLSNGGLLALVVATVLGGLFGLARRAGGRRALVAAMLVLIVSGTLVETLDVRGWVTVAEQSNALVRDSLGRESESGGSRATLAQEGIRTWLHGGSVFGVGPGNTESTLRAQQAPYVKEAHDDYLAALLERGVLGGLALVLLICGVGIRARRAARVGGVAPDFLAIVPRPEILAAAVVAVAVSGMFYEVLHFRHVWALFGLVAALQQSGRAS
jgi:O-antigen ligase